MFLRICKTHLRGCWIRECICVCMYVCIIHSLHTHKILMHDEANCKLFIVAAVCRLYITFTRATLHQHGSVRKVIHYCLGIVTNATNFL